MKAAAKIIPTQRFSNSNRIGLRELKLDDASDWLSNVSWPAIQLIILKSHEIRALYISLLQRHN